MLTVEERFMIKELHRQGKTVNAIARETGHDRKTVRKVIAGELMVRKEARKREPTLHRGFVDASHTPFAECKLSPAPDDQADAS